MPWPAKPSARREAAPPGGFVHVFTWDNAAADVPTEGRQVGRKLRHGAWKCVMCHTLASWAAKYDRYPNDCPGAWGEASGQP